MNPGGRKLIKGVELVRFLVLEGDGIGPELCRATVAVLDAVKAKVGFALAFNYERIGFAALEDCGTTFPDAALNAALAADGVILGPVSHNEYPPVAEGGLNPSGELRKRLDLYTNIRPARSRPGLLPPCGKQIDLVTMRENTEGFYSDRSMHLGPGEMMPTPDVALSFRKVTRAASIRIAEASFRLARQRRRRVTAVHKANVLRISDGLFLECVREVAARFPDVDYEEELVDAMAALLIRDPSKFDVVCTTNMFGDILSDQAAELSGSLGLAASLNAGDTYAVAQAQHGAAPNIAGRGLANPSSLIGAAGMLLGWLGERKKNESLLRAASMIDDALDLVISVPEQRTRDLGGPLGTEAFTQHVISEIENSS